MCLAVTTLRINLATFANILTASDKKKRPRVKGKIGSKDVEFLIDSGAGCTMISDTLFKSQWGHWNIRTLPMPPNIWITGVNGNTIQVVDYIEAEICILGRSFCRMVLVIASLELIHAIIGWDMIKKEDS